MSRLRFVFVLMMVLSCPQPALANGSMNLLVYFISLPGAVLLSWLAALSTPAIKALLLRTVLPSACDQPEQELLAQVTRQEWIVSSLAYALAMGPGMAILEDLADIGSRDGLLVYTVALYVVIHVAAVFARNKSLGSALGKKAWESLSGAGVVVCSLLLSLVTPCVFIILCGVFVCVFVVAVG